MLPGTKGSGWDFKTTPPRTMSNKLPRISGPVRYFCTERDGQTSSLLIKLLYFTLGYPRITTPRIYLIIIPRLNSYNSLSLSSLVLTSFYARSSKNLANSFSLSRDESHSVGIVFRFLSQIAFKFLPSYLHV